jgi:hypothetical protein
LKRSWKRASLGGKFDVCVGVDQPGQHERPGWKRDLLNRFKALRVVTNKNDTPLPVQDNRHILAEARAVKEERGAETLHRHRDQTGGVSQS